MTFTKTQNEQSFLGQRSRFDYHETNEIENSNALFLHKRNQYVCVLHRHFTHELFIPLKIYGET